MTAIWKEISEEERREIRRRLQHLLFRDLTDPELSEVVDLAEQAQWLELMFLGNQVEEFRRHSPGRTWQKAENRDCLFEVAKRLTVVADDPEPYLNRYWDEIEGYDPTDSQWKRYLATGSIYQRPEDD